MTPASGWTTQEIGDLTGRRAVVTGVTGDLGRHTAQELARHGAEVVISGRNEAKLVEAARVIREAVPGARLVPLVMDLADLSSVRAAAAAVADKGPIDILVNNAGVMATPDLRTVDGFDLQMASNHFGHFAFTGLLLPHLVSSGNARVVAVASQAHRIVSSVPLEDPRIPPSRYSKWRAYGQSKLANLLFTYELDRRTRAAGLPVTATAAHPGYAATGLFSAGLALNGRNPVAMIVDAASRVVGQSPDMGALPLLMAATADLPAGTYVGPGGPGEMRGMPQIVGTSRAARDEQLAAAFWTISEDATGVRYP